MTASATTLIRDDHARVLSDFHGYRLDFSPIAKRALADNICLELELHAQLEEEIVYPAMRFVDPALVDKGVPEHDEMRRLIALLRATPPASPEYDVKFMELMCSVMHHVADEETALLPAAERLLREQLPELGAVMEQRRQQLAPPAMAAPSRRSGRSLTRRLARGVVLVPLGGLMAAYAVGHGIRRAISPRT
ncbi:MAG: hemerythrin domain-containing protein [Betaproteobacteria bacterium]